MENTSEKKDKRIHLSEIKLESLKNLVTFYLLINFIQSLISQPFTYLFIHFIQSLISLTVLFVSSDISQKLGDLGMILTVQKRKSTLPFQLLISTCRLLRTQRDYSRVMTLQGKYLLTPV